MRVSVDTETNYGALSRVQFTGYLIESERVDGLATDLVDSIACLDASSSAGESFHTPMTSKVPCGVFPICIPIVTYRYGSGL